MRYSIIAAITGFLCLTFYATPGFALSCRHLGHFVIAQCSKAHCSKGFSVHSRYWGMCNIWLEPDDIEAAGLDLLRQEFPQLDNEEKLVIFDDARVRCVDSTSKLSEDPELRLNYKSQTGKQCLILYPGYIKLRDITALSERNLGRISAQQIAGKNYEELHQIFFEDAAKAKLQKILSLVGGIVIYIVLLVLTIWLVRRITISSMHLIFKTLLIPPLILAYLALLVLQN